MGLYECESSMSGVRSPETGILYRKSVTVKRKSRLPFDPCAPRDAPRRSPCTRGSHCDERDQGAARVVRSDKSSQPECHERDRKPAPSAVASVSTACKSTSGAATAVHSTFRPTATHALTKPTTSAWPSVRLKTGE